MASQDEARVVDLHQSLHRPELFMGAERIPMMLTGLIALLVGLGSMNVYVAVLAVLFWFGTVCFLRKMAQADNLMSKIFMRYLKYKPFYPARTSVWSRNKK